ILCGMRRHNGEPGRERLMIDPGAGKIPLVAHSQTSFTMEGTGVGVRQGRERRGDRDDPALDGGRSVLGPQEVAITSILGSGRPASPSRRWGLGATLIGLPWRRGCFQPAAPLSGFSTLLIYRGV